MKRFISVLVCLFLVISCAKKELQSVTFFTHDGCPYCEKALQYIHLNYPKLPMHVLEIGEKENLIKFLQCAQKFNLDRKKLGTPLICMDNHYIMGWSKEEQKLFNQYVQPYLQKK